MHLCFQQKKVYLIILALFLAVQSLSGQYTIKGNLKSQLPKYEKLFLEYLPSFHDINSLDANNVLNTCLIQANGDFIMTGAELPKQKSLYRLGLTSGDSGFSISSGMINSFMILTLDKNTVIEINNCRDSIHGFSNCTLEGDEESRVLQVISNKIVYNKFKTLRENYPEMSKTREQFILKKYVDDLKLFADTSSYLLPALCALGYLPNLEEEYKNDPLYFDELIDSWLPVKKDDIYFRKFYKEILLWRALHGQAQKAILSVKSIYLLSTLLLLLIICMAYIYWLRKQLTASKKTVAQHSTAANRLDQLSKKEKEVLKLILDNKSNKEIASDLYIELTTVKSHITKIYQKLGVSNRKDLFTALKG